LSQRNKSGTRGVAPKNFSSGDLLWSFGETFFGPHIQSSTSKCLFIFDALSFCQTNLIGNDDDFIYDNPCSSNDYQQVAVVAWLNEKKAKQQLIACSLSKIVFMCVGNVPVMNRRLADVDCLCAPVEVSLSPNKFDITFSTEQLAIGFPITSNCSDDVFICHHRRRNKHNNQHRSRSKERKEYRIAIQRTKCAEKGSDKALQ
jgi:hypothetical protein